MQFAGKKVRPGPPDRPVFPQFPQEPRDPWPWITLALAIAALVVSIMAWWRT